MGLLHTIDFCKNLGFSRLAIEGDCLQVLNILNRKTKDWSDASMLVSDAFLLLQSFAIWFADHVHREANSVAHMLAKHALSLAEDAASFECILDCIKHLVNLDNVILK